MRIISLVILLLSLSFADIGNQISKNKSEQNTIRKSKQTSNQNSASTTKSKTKGNEKSTSTTVSNTLSKIMSLNHTVSKTANSSWNITLNPIPYILSELRYMGWSKKSFFITQNDIGAIDYIVDDDEEYGELQNTGKMQAVQSRASNRHRLGRKEIENLQKFINLLYYTAKVVENSTQNLQSFPSMSIEEFENRVKRAVLVAYKNTITNPIYIRNCNFAGDINSYSCNDGKYTLVLTNSFPNLYINGAPYYSATSVGFINPTLNISFATNTNEAFSKLAQNQDSNSITGMVRDYTSKLIQKGHSEIATKIRNKFVEKSLNHGVNANATTMVQAINSGSPMAVLKLFQ